MWYSSNPNLFSKRGNDTNVVRLKSIKFKMFNRAFFLKKDEGEH